MFRKIVIIDFILMVPRLADQSSMNLLSISLIFSVFLLMLVMSWWFQFLLEILNQANLVARLYGILLRMEILISIVTISKYIFRYP